MAQWMRRCGPGTFKERQHHPGRDISNARGQPFGRVVFVHRQGSNALDSFAADTSA